MNCSLRRLALVPVLRDGSFKRATSAEQECRKKDFDFQSKESYRLT